MNICQIIKKKGYIMLFMTLFLLSLSCMLITTNIYEKEQNEKISRGFYTENAQTVTISEVINEKDFKDWFKSKEYEECIVYKTDFLKNIDCRGIAFEKSLEGFPLQSGRTFTAEESRSGAKIVMLGGSLLKEAVKRDGKQYFNIENQEYEVVGVIGRRNVSRLDHMVFMPIGTAMDLKGMEGKYVLDGNNVERAADSIFEKWSKSATLNFSGTAFHQSITIQGETEENSVEKIQTAIYLAVLFSFLLTVASCMLYWIKYRRQRIEAMQILGCSRWSVLKAVSLSYFSIFMAAFIAGIVVVALLWWQGIIVEIRTIDVLFAIAVTFLAGYLFVVGHIVLQAKEEKSGNRGNSILADCIISVQFAIFFWIFVQLIGYYVDLGNDSWVQTCKGNYSYLTMGLGEGESSFDRMVQLEETPFYHKHAQNALKKVRSQKDFSYMSYTKDWVLRLDMDTIEEHFGKEDYSDFLSGSLYPGFYDTVQVIPKPEPQELDGVNQLQFSFCSMDYNAVKHYNLRVQEGELFGESDFSVSKEATEFPVILGAAYAPYFSVGDTFSIYGSAAVYTGKVIGILQENTRIITDLTKEENAYPTVLDYDIILPFMNFEDFPEEEKLQAFVKENDTRQLLGIAVTEGEMKNSTKLEVQKLINEIYREEGLFTVIACDTTLGVALFQNETRQSVMILTVLIIVVLGFNIFSLCISLINKINSKMRRYSIELMNGCTVNQIFRTYFIEIFLVTVTGFAVAVFLHRYTVLIHLKYLYVMGAIWISLLALSSVVVWRKLSTADMEMLMRRKE